MRFPRGIWVGLALLALASSATVVAPAASGFGVATPVASASAGPWGKPKLIDPPGGELNSISCAHDGFCAATDVFGDVVTRVGGAWGPVVRVQQKAPTALSCGSSTLCVIIGPGNQSQVFDGATWTPSAPRIAPQPLVGVSCASATFCVSVTSRTASIYDGTTWSRPTRVESRDVALTSVSCASNAFCVAGDESGRAVMFSGHRWSAPQQTSLGTFFQVSCATGPYCMGTDGSLGTAVYDGSLWRTVREPTVPGLVACAASHLCVSAEGSQAATFNGAHWSAPDTIDRDGFVISVSCASTRDCTAVDQSGNALLFDGTTWSQAETIDPVKGGVAAMSCPSASFCASVDYSGYALTYDGSRWSSPVVISSGSWRDEDPEISCSSATFCAAASYGSGNVFTYDGHGWSPAQTTGLSFVGALSCPTSTFCVAAGDIGGGQPDAGAVSTFDGTSWSPARVIDAQSVAISALSCTSPTFCVALAYGKNVTTAMTWNGVEWTSPTIVIDAQVFVMSASCSSTTFCLAVTEGGDYLTYDGATWSPWMSMPTHYEKPFGVSCPTPALCVAAVKDSVMIFDGTSWTDPERIDFIDPPEFGDYVLTTMSCPTTHFCATQDYQGRAFMTTTP